MKTELNKMLKQLESQAEANAKKAEAMLQGVENPALKAILSSALEKAKKGEGIDMNEFINSVSKFNG